MSISAYYSQPVYVNGYVCWDCHQVAEAQKDINPATPVSASGAPASATPASSQSSAVVLGGVLAQQAGTATSAPPSAAAAPPLLNIIV
jgi:hypothetical protein